MVTGSVPTEKLPEKSHNIPKPERRTVQRRQTLDTSTSTALSQKIFSIEDLNKQVQKKSIHPWLTNKSKEDEVGFELFDECHCIPKYTVVVDSTLEFSIFAYNWPVPDDNEIFKETKCSVKYLEMAELLKSIKNSCLCEGLGQDENVLSVTVDPTCNPDNLSLLYDILFQKIFLWMIPISKCQYHIEQLLVR